MVNDLKEKKKENEIFKLLGRSTCMIEKDLNIYIIFSRNDI